MKYKPVHPYEMQPFTTPSTLSPSATSATYNAALPEQLRQLKKLVDEKVITPAEYEAQKKKLLGE